MINLVIYLIATFNTYHLYVLCSIPLFKSAIPFTFKKKKDDKLSLLRYPLNIYTIQYT